MKRICVYLTYDKQKIIDTYIGYMLGELRTCVDSLVVVCNMTEVLHGTIILEKYADEIFYRENIGFDAGGFKDALCNYIGWNRILEYDELILVNDSLFGPFKPMKNIFSEMEDKETDFWGLAKHASNGTSIPEHVQTYFLVIRSKMLHSIEFRRYWEDMPYYSTFSDVVHQHEVKFTPYFKELGYTYDVLADIKANDSKNNLANNYMQYALISYELIQKRNFPFLKKQQLGYETLAQQTQENLYQAINYIDKETSYNANLIWENIIRTMNMTDLQRSLHLQYIISSEEKKLSVKRDIAIVVFAEYKSAVEYVLEYLNKLSRRPDYFIQIISESDKILEAYKINMSGENTLVLKHKCDLTELSHYDYVCVLHDTDMTSDIKPSCTGKSYFYCIWENLFKNENHIVGILGKFERKEKLGFLAPPQPDFADYFGKITEGWSGKYREIKKIAQRLELSSQISEDKPPFSVTDNFWIRGDILNSLKGVKADEYPYIIYLWIYFAQHKGYYSGMIESADYASMNEVNLQYYLKSIVAQVKNQYGNFDTFEEMNDKILSGALNLFCEKYSRIIIYGTGHYAKKYKNFFTNIEAYIISDGQEKTDYFEEIPVKYISEIENLEECGIVLCLNKKNQLQVIPLLEQRNVRNYFCIS